MSNNCIRTCKEIKANDKEIFNYRNWKEGHSGIGNAVRVRQKLMLTLKRQTIIWINFILDKDEDHGSEG